tara:strand:- start:64 stop:318 length:255 start_codon:yes stop_codon:yes gene_type:complete
MSRICKIIEKNIKIKNYEPFINYYSDLDSKLIGLTFPSSRFIKSKQNYVIPKNKNQNKEVYKVEKNFTNDEKIIGLDFPSSRFN